MPTRLYLPASGAAAVNPPFDGAWEKFSEADRLQCVPTRSNSAFASKTSSENIATSSYDFLTRQYVSKPLAAQSLGGTAKGQVKCLESSVQADFCRALVIKVVSNDGQTVRGTLLSHFPASLTSEYSNTSLTNRYFPPAGTGLGSVEAQAGDRLVIEIGTRSFNASSTNRTATHRFGDASATDLPENESETLDYNPWIEFSQTIAFHSVSGTGAAMVAAPGAAASGKHGIKGTGAATFSSSTAAASGVHGVAGLAGGTAPAPGATAAGWAAVTGTAAVRVPSCPGAAAGRHGVSGAAAGAPSTPAGSGSGGHGAAGSGAPTLAAPWASGTGTYTPAEVSGTGAAQVAALSAGAGGKHGVSGTALAVAEVPGAAASGRQGVAGAGDALSPAAGAGAWGSFGGAWFGQGAAAVPVMVADGYGLTGSGQPSVRRLYAVRELRVLRLPEERRVLATPGEIRMLPVAGESRILPREAEERILRRVA